ncbi:MAG: hypothetical protein WD490_06885 [Opitutales bacterium]
MKKQHWILLGLIFVVTAVVRFIAEPGEFPAFYAVFGFVACLVFLFLAKVAGKKVLMREEDYYNES